MDDLLCIYKTDIVTTNPRFWKSVFIWHDRPHVINRRLIGASVFCVFRIIKSVTVKAFLDNFGSYKLQDERINSAYCAEIGYVEKILCCPSDVTGNQYILMKKIWHKGKDRHDIEVTFIDGHQKLAIFCPAGEACFPYGIQYKNGAIQLLILQTVPHDNSYVRWLIDKVIPKIKQWATEDEIGTGNIIRSLRLISTEKYSQLYLHLKRKYGNALTKIWTECTDPLKFIYEDIAIATYLCLLWENKKQKFVDMGCGNGLLVHILNSEGHDGIGLDIRSRKIWALYPPSTVLKVATITPTSADCLSSDVDWIIGNHSDELTPWIPVKAACNSYACKFFLLPCCAYEFSGSRYQRRNSSKSVYEDYMQYIENICRQIGFDVQVDRLRIPSTKRTCLIGRARTYSVDLQSEIPEKIEKCIGENSSSSSNDQSLLLFVARDAKQAVRNCTQLNRILVDDIVQTVADVLLKKQIETAAAASSMTDIWLCDYSIDLKTLASYIAEEKLAQIKNECKGLQTLLKNHHYIFQVDKGRVKFRKPTEHSSTAAAVGSGKYKKKLCWFYQKHPYSCPLQDDQCSFVHREISSK